MNTRKTTDRTVASNTSEVDRASRLSALTPPKGGRLDTRQVLQEVFRLQDFKDGQEEVITACLQGENVLVNKATGWGKALCFQLPAVVDHRRTGGLTVVVSPLIALIKEQVAKLRTLGIGVAELHSGLSASQYREEEVALTSPQTAMVYLSPEKLATRTFSRLVSQRKVARIVVDEAHCISSWGHDFRPLYLRIPSACKELGNPPVSLLTATAPVLVRDDVLRIMGLPEGEYRYFSADPTRSNLSFSTLSFYSDHDRRVSLLTHVKEAAQRKEPTIVYCGQIAHVEQICEALEELDVTCRPYHAKMESAERSQSQALFTSDVVPVLVATKAFGMGIDKPNVRNVYHLGFPVSLEDYYQEAGRAGRDGANASCILFRSSYDAGRLITRIKNSQTTVDSVKQLYFRLWNSVPMSERTVSSPSVYFDLNSYFASFKIEIPRIKESTQASFGALLEFGVIEQNGRRVTFNITPSDFEETSSFPVTRELLEGKKSRDLEKAAVMLFYGSQQGEEKAIIRDHFMFNSVVSHAQNWFRSQAVQVDESLREAVSALLIKKDWEVVAMIEQLRSAALIENSQISHLQTLSLQEFRFQLEHLASTGHVRLLRIGEKTFVTEDEKSVSTPFSQRTSYTALNTWDKLREKMYSPAAKKILRNALRDWFASERPNNSMKKWYAAFKCFDTEEFTILDKAVTGRSLMEAYFHARYSKKDEDTRYRSHLKELLLYLYGDELKDGFPS
jgi:RecQ family ATP-dependent DNA helicase